MKRSVLIAALVLARVAESAQICESTGDVAPPSLTLMASTTAPTTHALLVAANCTTTTASLNKLDLTLRGQSVDRVVSLPSDTKTLTLSDNPLSRGANFGGATKLSAIYLYRFTASMMNALTLPSSLGVLVLESSPVKSVKSLKVPDTLKRLTAKDLGLSSFSLTLPRGLIELDLSSNYLSSMSIPIPGLLEHLRLTGNPITKLVSVSLPSTLIKFECESCDLTTVRGIRWPSTLTTLKLKQNTITAFELRASDVQLFAKLTEFDVEISQFKCTDKTASIVVIKGQNFCVISNDRFEQVYSGNGDTGGDTGGNTGGGGDTGTGNGTGGDGSSGNTEGGYTPGENNGSSSGLTENSPSRDGTNTPGDGTTPSDQNGGTGVNGGSQASSNQSPNGSPGGSPSISTDKTTTTASSNTLVIVVATGGSVFAVLIGIIGFRVFVSSKTRKHDDENHKYTEAVSPGTTSNDATNGHSLMSSQEYLLNDVRNDRMLLPLRIDQSDIRVGRQLARGGFGVIFHGTYQGRDVAIKRMLPNTWRDDAQLASFMEEIRLCAKLEHPKIVQFIGISWGNLSDLAAIIEYLPGGDLHGLLSKQTKSPSPQDWFERWAAGQASCKLSLARDVVEALVYLHSFEKAILHRDLKARNVLITGHGDAKLSDFGISREMSADETMTAEIGTAAWIAPEVLRGERYSEKADIYSLGVLLVELDRCRHPYSYEKVLSMSPSSSLGSMGTSHISHKNTQIAMLVSTGTLRPRPTADCPHKVKDLIAECLRFNPHDRPTAMEVHFALHKVRKAVAKSADSPTDPFFLV